MCTKLLGKKQYHGDQYKLAQRGEPATCKLCGGEGAKQKLRELGGREQQSPTACIRDCRAQDQAEKQPQSEAIKQLAVKVCAAVESDNAVTGNGTTPLYAAAQNGSVELIALFLKKKGCNPNQARADNGETAMHVAAWAGRADIVQLLLEHNADPDQARTDDGATPLYIATQEGHAELVDILLKHNADPNQAEPDYGTTPLYIAVCEGHIASAAMLLERNADPNQATTVDGSTPLHSAAHDGQGAAITMLLTHKADPNIVAAGDGTTPLYYAAQGGHVEAVNALLLHNADPNQATADGSSAPLCIASQKGHVEVVAMLLTGGKADPDIRVADAGTTPLYLAAQNGHAEAVATLLEHKADPNQATTDSGTAPLYVAAQNGHVAVVEQLVKGDADPNQRGQTDLFGRKATPLYVAAQGGHVEVVSVLVKGDADPNQGRTNMYGRAGMYGTSPLYIAAYQGHLNAVHTLLKSRADPNQARVHDGATPLLSAATKRHGGVVKVLLRHHADPNAGCPLHAACSFEGDVAVAQQLAVFGADVSLEDPNGFTPAQLATRNHPDLATWLAAVSTWPRLRIAAACRLHSELAFQLQHGMFDPDHTNVAGAVGAQVFESQSASFAAAIAAAGSTPGHVPWPDAPPVCDATLQVVRAATQGWAPERHTLHHAGVRVAVKAVLLTSQRLARAVDAMFEDGDKDEDAAEMLQNLLPSELWESIMFFFLRSWWSPEQAV